MTAPSPAPTPTSASAERPLLSIRSRGPRGAGRADLGVELDGEVSALIASDAPVAVGVSGGKDSCAAAIAVVEHLDRVGHRGPRLLVHAHLGDDDPAADVEWTDSLPTCRRLAARLGLELVVVRRRAGGMVRRWEERWRRCLARYRDLSCVKVILPWSTPSMRFCTSELKSAPIAAELRRRFPGRQIVSACGVRREESRARSATPTSKPNKRLTDRRGTGGLDWNPIAAWMEEDVRALCAARDFDLHEAYARGMRRVSCRFCIMQDEHDQRTSAGVAEHIPLLVRLATLEARSTFGFQGSRWIADLRPEVLPDALRAEVPLAKERAERRRRAESRIPEHLLYTEGWPRVMPTPAEAAMIAEVRVEVAAALGVEVTCTDAASVIERYAELMAERAARHGSRATAARRSREVPT